MSSFPFCWEPAASCQNGKVHETGKVVLVLAGCYSRQKVIIVKNIDDGFSDHPYSRALMTRIDLYPRTVTAAMGKKKIAKWSKIKSFAKAWSKQSKVRAPRPLLCGITETLRTYANPSFSSKATLDTDARRS
ncbi:60S ribosomal protein L27 [Microtus ochrogaster]|uniref:60S ribosomal protein L27 n=1 Tax=Microtus ochrogaster TaxID=79684 RepID=A0A8J6KVD7_MICOH|nr:60S ribosomal protein L27 [Microtus ochrogaster]